MKKLKKVSLITSPDHSAVPKQVIRSLMDVVKKFLLSPKTVITLICAAGIFCVTGSLVPQLAQRPPEFFETWSAKNPVLYRIIDFLQFNQVFTSAWFLVLIALIASSLTLSIFYQTKALIRSGRVDTQGFTKIPFKDSVTVEAAQNPDLKPGKLYGEIKGILQHRGYRPYGEGDTNGHFVFVKNRTGRWSSVIFHAGFVVIIVAALFVLAFQERGFVQLTESKTFAGREDGWRAKKLGVFADDFNLDFRVQLKKFTPSYWETGKVENMESILVITDKTGNSRELPVSLRGPVEFDGVKIHQSENYGYSVKFIQERQGKAPVTANFLLDAPVKKNGPYSGRTDFEATGYQFDMKFYPNMTEPSFHAANAGLDLVVTEKEVQRFKGRVLLNQKVRVGHDTLAFTQIRYWTGLILTRNYGMPGVYAGFALGTLGAVMIFMLSYREIHVQIAEENGRVRVHMGGKAKSDQAIFSEEFREISEMLRKVIGEYGNRSIA